MMAGRHAVHALLAIALLATTPAAAQESEPMNSLVAQDLRLATVAERMLAANAPLCRQQMPLTGMIIHTQDQYPDGAIPAAFANGNVAIEAIVPGSPASAAVAEGDGIAAIGDVMTAGLQKQGKSPVRDSVFDVLAEQAPAAPLTLAIVRFGQQQQVTLEPVPGCRALVEIKVDGSIGGRSDGRVIQIDLGFARVATDDEMAVIFAHELGHLVLEHRRRLTEAGVEKGFFGEFGRNQRLNRQVEEEADLMSVHILANAGYDPRIAPAYWRSDLGKRMAGSFLTRSRTHASASSRAEMMDREINDYLGAGAGPSNPAHLLSRRDIPFER